MQDRRKLLNVYLRLARVAEERQKPYQRDKFLVLAGATAAAMQMGDLAEGCRRKILENNRGHVLSRFGSFQQALADKEFVTYLGHLERQWPFEKAEHLLAHPALQGAEPQKLSDEDMAARLLGLEEDPAESASERTATSSSPTTGEQGVPAARPPVGTPQPPKGMSQPPKSTPSRPEAIGKPSGAGAPARPQAASSPPTSARPPAAPRGDSPPSQRPEVKQPEAMRPDAAVEPAGATPAEPSPMDGPIRLKEEGAAMDRPRTAVAARDAHGRSLPAQDLQRRGPRPNPAPQPAGAVGRRSAPDATAVWPSWLLWALVLLGGIAVLAACVLRPWL